MQESYKLFLAIHIYSLYASAFLMFFYLFLSQRRANEFDFIHKIRLFLPIFYLFLAFVFFTGILLQALGRFYLNLNILLMIFAWILIFFLAIFHFICFKKARRAHNYKNYKKLSFAILSAEFLLLFLPNLSRFF